MKNRYAIVFYCVVCTCLSCAPKIVVIDRATLIEQETAGQWPDFEKQLSVHEPGIDPVPITPKQNSQSLEDKRVFRVLNGPFSPTDINKK